MQLQQTLKKDYSFEGKGLHTGRVATMTVCPAPADSGIRFVRTDIGEDAIVEALAENVSNTARSTTISKGDASVSTMHLLHTNRISAHVVDSCKRKTVYVGGCSLSFRSGLYRRIVGKPCKSKGFSLVLKKIRLILW